MPRKDDPSSEMCQVCGDWRGEDKMLLCDDCDLGFHIFCLNPPLQSVPEGDWSCPFCVRERIKDPAKFYHIDVEKRRRANRKLKKLGLPLLPPVVRPPKRTVEASGKPAGKRKNFAELEAAKGKTATKKVKKPKLTSEEGGKPDSTKKTQASDKTKLAKKPRKSKVDKQLISASTEIPSVAQAQDLPPSSRDNSSIKQQGQLPQSTAGTGASQDQANASTSSLPVRPIPRSFPQSVSGVASSPPFRHAPPPPPGTMVARGAPVLMAPFSQQITGPVPPGVMGLYRWHQ